MTQMPGPNVNQASSGTYGEKADLNKLKASLPPMQAQPAQAGGQAPVRPASTMMASQPTMPTPNDPLLHPTAMPDVPVNTPLQQSEPMDPWTMPPDQRTLAILDLLASSDQVSQKTKVFAQAMKDRLARGNRSS